MLGFVAAAESARTMMLQARAHERLQLLLDTDSMQLKRMLAWAIHRIRYGGASLPRARLRSVLILVSVVAVYSFAFEAETPAEPVGNVAAYVILLGAQSYPLQRFAAAELDTIVTTRASVAG
jgi:hypothetical protein